MKDNQLTNSQLEYLKENLPPSIAAVAFGIIAIVVVFYGEVPDGWLTGWSICAWAVLLFRIWVYLYLKRTSVEHLNSIQAKNLILISATATGICWGAASIIFAMHTDDVTLWVFLAFFMSGYASGAVFSTSALLPACAGYFFPTIVPITVWFFAQEIPHTRWMGMLLVVFTVAAWNMARNSHKYLVDSVQKQIALREARLELAANQSKTGALQTMAGGIAHDFNNLFSGMVSTLYLLEKESLSAKGEKYLNMMQKNVDSGSQLSTKMLNYSRASLCNNETLSVNQLVGERIKHVSEMFGTPDLEIALNATGEELNIFGDKKQLSQVIDALLVNACESYPEETGKIMVSISSSDVTDINHDGTIQIEVRDFGCGMSEDVLEKIYEPFFSTKFTGRGLGMSVVFGVVKRMGGTIAIDSKPNQGTTVALSFPGSLSDLGQS